jgi:hypothetical protein
LDNCRSLVCLNYTRINPNRIYHKPVLLKSPYYIIPY